MNWITASPGQSEAPPEGAGITLTAMGLNAGLTHHQTQRFERGAHEITAMEDGGRGMNSIWSRPDRERN